jgi:hypothetical protein
MAGGFRHPPFGHRFIFGIYEEIFVLIVGEYNIVFVVEFTKGVPRESAYVE